MSLATYEPADRLTSAAPVFFAATLFTSAALMFLVEPLLGKMLLPQLGGSAAVWNTCLVFYQTVLLLGYAYADRLTRLRSRRLQAGIHFGLVIPAALLTLPPSLQTSGTPTAGSPVFWLLENLAWHAGLPFFALAATAPLLQSWFSRLQVRGARDPYFLYASSNAGSFFALLAYPFLVEASIGLASQARVWTFGFVLLTGCLGLCAAPMLRSPSGTAPARGVTAPVARQDALRWVGLALVPSALLMAATTYVATATFSAPLIWMIPLGLYLLSFVAAFASRPPIPHSGVAWALPSILIVVALTTVMPVVQSVPALFLAIHSAGLFAACLFCHGELARQRPLPESLTRFYLCLSSGGVLGGTATALLAPLIFPDVWEYPLALVLVCLVRGRSEADRRGFSALDLLGPVLLLGLVAGGSALIRAGMVTSPVSADILVLLVLIAPALMLLHFSSRRTRFAAGLAACLTAGILNNSNGAVLQARSFFGIYKVARVEEAGAPYMVMMHGTTLHGVRNLAPGEDRTPTAYYSQPGPFGHIFSAQAAAPIGHVAVVGLGTGTLLCYAQPGQAWTFYEIDPLVIRLALQPQLFGFVQKCGNPDIVAGDARLQLAKARDQAFDVVIIDAFAGDDIPMHLITREALALYIQKLAPHGRIAFHISSRTLNLVEVTARLAADAGLVARLDANGMQPSTLPLRRSPARVIVMARQADDLGDLDAAHGWTTLSPASDAPLWTDDRSSVLEALRFGVAGGHAAEATR